MKDNLDLVFQMLQYGVTFTPHPDPNLLQITKQFSVWEQQGIEWEDALDCNDAVRAIMERSATRLEEFIQRKPELIKAGSRGISGLEWANILAWPEGCEILWKHRLFESFGTNSFPRFATNREDSLTDLRR